ncbi:MULTISPECIES: hypothetical protein [unclassified Mameliella]|uniref:hypothetical protein n=1 Tax=unclassified Mameliella TaxID=2630630 RepID=UPI00273F3F43|nr:MULTISPECIES: hypothetical protein [unclassified Mameliella]
MTDKPILFSGPMVRALLDGRKTQTRRVIKDRGVPPQFCGGLYDAKNDPECWGWEDHNRGEWITLDQSRHWRFVPCAIGYRLWVREAWRTSRHYDDLKPSEMGGEEPVQFVADGAVDAHAGRVDDLLGRKRPGMFMPRWASRLTLIVTDVRVQRVQEISAEDARAEGVDVSTGDICRDGHTLAYRIAFQHLWNSLNAPRGYGWDVNPWVAAYTFQVHRQNIDQMTNTLQQMRTT